MRQILFLGLLTLPFLSAAQHSEVLLGHVKTPKLIVDSVEAIGDTLRVDLFQASGGRVVDLKSTFHHSRFRTGQNLTLTGVVAANAGQFSNLNVSGLTNLGTTVTGGSASFSSMRLTSFANANPLFQNRSGGLSKESEMQFKTVGAAAFHPERISPIEAAGNFTGQVSIFQNLGEVIGISPSNANPYRLIAPLEISLNSFGELENIVIRNMKFCFFDSDGLVDLAAIIYRVNSSEGSSGLITEPMMGLKSSGLEPFYRCVEFKESDFREGNEFALDQSDNSYYISVYPIQPGSKIFETQPTPWSIDQPGLKLVHVIVQYQHQ